MSLGDKVTFDIERLFLEYDDENAINILFSKKAQIIKYLGNIATYYTGWNKELNIVSWNGGQPKYDIRDWDPDHKHYSRGITLSEKGARKLLKLLAGEFNDHEQFGELEIDKSELLGFLVE